MRIVISQPMFVPWLGLFEQVKLADVYVHYDDVKRPGGGSFMTRVQLKTGKGRQWLTAPIDKRRSGWLMSETFTVGDRAWRERHLAFIRQSYRDAAHFSLMDNLAQQIYAWDDDNLAGFNQNAIELIADWLELDTEFRVASELSVPGSSSQRVVDICRHFDATEYLTGHGASGYLEHELFESGGIDVRYIDYALTPYLQLHGEFTPYVTVLDAIANVGTKTRDLMVSGHLGWRQFLARRGA